MRAGPAGLPSLVALETKCVHLQLRLDSPWLTWVVLSADFGEARPLDSGLPTTLRGSEGRSRDCFCSLGFMLLGVGSGV